MALSTTELREWWDYELHPASSSSDIDFVSRDGSLLVEVQVKPQGMRGFYAGVMRLAIELNRRPEAKRGCLIVDASKLSMQRLKKEWNDSISVFGRKFAKQLFIIAVQESETWVDPKDDRFINKVASNVLNIPALPFQQPEYSPTIRAVRKSDEITKVLLLRWLQHSRPIGIGELGEHVGCSYPTVRKAIEKLAKTKHLQRTSGSAVQLTRFPELEWKRIVALAPTYRNTIRFTDRSGQRPNMKGLLSRLDRLRPENLAIGGVIAARHWHPDFDLNGIPRINLLLHAKTRSVDLDFMKKLDPALQSSDDLGESPAIVIHTIGRANPDFEATKKNALPIADPVETALDLIDLGLLVQAQELLSHFRKEARFS